MIYLEVCRSPPGSLPQIRWVPEAEEPQLLCHRILKMPKFYRDLVGKSYGSAAEAVIDVLGLGIEIDAVQLLNDLEAAMA